MGVIGQQIVRQVGEQHEHVLGQEALFRSCSRAQAVPAIVELFDFGSDLAMIERDEIAFYWL
jgi:hypothetical protein